MNLIFVHFPSSRFFAYNIDVRSSEIPDFATFLSFYLTKRHDASVKKGFGCAMLKKHVAQY